MAGPWESYAADGATAGPWAAYATGGDEAKPPSGAQRLGAALNDIPRQLGLTARYALEGPATAAQVVTEPLRYLTDRATVQTGKTKPLGAVATDFADTLGLPKPANDMERVVGEGTKLGFGAMAGSGAAKAADGVMQAGRAVIGTQPTIAGQLAANPLSQVTGAAGAGMAGQASKEFPGSGPWQQAGAALVGGLAGAFAPGALQAGANAVRNALPKAAPQTIDLTINTILQRQGIDVSQLPQQAREALRQDVAKALRMGDLDEGALGRLAAFRASGMTPTRGMISQNPVDITREQNLSKIAANSSNPELHVLPTLQNQNNAAMIGRLNDLGAGAGVLPSQAGQRVVGAVTARDAANAATEQSAWNAAKGAPGYTQPIYPDALGAMNKALGDEGLMPFMSPGVSKYIEALQMNPGSFTPQSYANLRSMLSAELAKGGNEARAARAAISAMEAAPMRPITGTARDIGQAPVTAATAGLLRSADQQAPDAIAAIDAARRATAQKYGYQDSNALVRSVLSDARSADPQRIANSFIVNGTADEARMVAQEVGAEGLGTIKNALANEIKRRALSDASDETGKVSASALNRAIKSMGEEKLGIFFSPEELQQLRHLNRAASLAMSQPAGSAVNNSNTGGLLIGKGLDALGAATNVPFLGPLVAAPLRDAAQNVTINLGNRSAQNVVPGLLQHAPAPAVKGGLAPLVIPAATFSGGLLSSQQ